MRANERFAAPFLVALLIVAPGHASGMAVQAARWSAVPVVRAGAVDGPGALADVFDVEVAADGTILVGQARSGAIALFAADGRYLRSVGRLGRGPGEFTVLGRMGWIGDTLWAVDFGRLHLFDDRLTFLRTIAPASIAVPEGVQRILPGPLMTDGSLVGIPISAAGTRPLPIVTLDSTGSMLQTLALIDPPPPTVRASFPNHQFVQLGSPTPAHPLWLTDPRGNSILIINRPGPERAGVASFDIVRIGLAGDTLMHRRIAYNAIEVDDAVTDRVFADYGRRFAQRFSITTAQAERSVRQVLSLARFHPPVSGFVTGRDGTIWLRREDMRTDSVEWHVFDEALTLRGTISLPVALTLHRAQSDRIWAVVRDSLDVPFVQVLQVRPLRQRQPGTTVARGRSSNR